MHRKSTVGIAILMGLMLIFPLATAWIPPGGIIDDGYYEDFGPRIDKILIKFYGTQEAMWDALEANEIDLTDWPLTAYYIDRWQDPPYSDYIKMVNYGGEAGYYIIDINNNPDELIHGVDGIDYPNPVYPNPTAVYSMRHAIAHMIDRPWIVSEVTAGLGLPMYTAVPTYMAAFVHPEIAPGGLMQDLTHPFSLTEAADILETGGFPMNTETGWRYWDKNDNGIQDTGEELNLISYSRSDDTARTMVGDDLYTKMTNLGISVTYYNVDKDTCSDNVMGAKNFNTYTGGWIFIGPDPDYLYYLYHMDWYWHPGKPINYDYAGHGLAADHPYQVSAYGTAFADTFADALGHTITFQEEFAVLCPAVPLWCWSGLKGMRDSYLGTPGVADAEDVYEGEGWKGFVNEMGFGTNSWWSTLNAHTDGHEAGDGSHMTLRYGFKVTALDKLNPISAQWYWSWEILTRTYDSMIMRDPQLEWRPYIAYDWMEELWVDPDDGETKSKITFYLNGDVYFWDGQQLTSEDVYFSLVEVRDTLRARGLPDPWWISNVENIKHVVTPDEFTVIAYMDVRTYAALGLVGGNIILPEHIWRPIVEVGDPTTFQPDPTLCGSGQFKFVEYVEGSHVLLEANTENYCFNDIELYIPNEQASPGAGGNVQGFMGIYNRRSTAWVGDITLEYFDGANWQLLRTDTGVSIPARSGIGMDYRNVLYDTFLWNPGVTFRISTVSPMRGAIQKVRTSHVTVYGDIDSSNSVGPGDGAIFGPLYDPWRPPVYWHKADINLDGVVGMLDVPLIGVMYGQPDEPGWPSPP